MSDLLKQAQAAAAKLADQTEDKGGNFEYEPPVAGPCVARFISYIEIGTHPQRAYQGKDKPPAPEAIIEFELLGKKHAKEIEITNEDGSKTKKTIYPVIRERVAIKSGPRAGFYKMLSAMDYGRGNTHMAFMLGEAFILTIIHNEVEKDGKKRTYANIKDDSGNWKIGAPVRVNEEGETEPLKAPEATVEPRLLLWDAPSIEQWNSIFIPGSYTKKDGDKEVEVSKNWLQTTCKEALNFEGSPLQNVILASIDGDLPEVDVDPDSAGGSESAAESEEADLGVDTPDEVEKAPAGDDSDPLADLGL
ncbi:hypothetical protein ParaMal1_00040 [Paracoccus phage ParMal1]|uniref:Uncharacterized protein n=1 Tax=Paracoccus phage ParMal1 TaxID=3032416 RepID=A0AAF0FNU1_9CAUD|nr:hypothetical protein ParaMal1_00040 [Paracoccus phage ParMal1]